MDDEQTTLIRFTDATRKLIMNRYIDERIKVVSDPQNWINFGLHIREAELFVRGLESKAKFKWRPLEQNKRRREKIETVARALVKLIDAVQAADDSSLSYAVGCGLTEVYALGNYSDRDREEVASFIKKYRFQEMIYDLQHRYKQELAAFALGVSKSSYEIPALDKNHTNEFKTAVWIEEFLERRDVPFTTSDTGLAGLAFLETMQLMNIQIERAQYWLQKAKDGDSWKKYIEGARAREREIQKNGAE